MERIGDIEKYLTMFGLPVEFQVPNGFPFPDDEPHGFKADTHVRFSERGRHTVVAFLSLDAFWNHGIVGNQQQSPRGDVAIEPAREECGGFHVNSHGPRFPQILLESLVMFPHPPVGGINGSGPIVAGVVPQSRRNGTLQHECR